MALHGSAASKCAASFIAWIVVLLTGYAPHTAVGKSLTIPAHLIDVVDEHWELAAPLEGKYPLGHLR